MSTASLDNHTNAISTTTSSDHTITAMKTAMSTITRDDHTDVVATIMPTTLLETNAETTIMSTTSLDDHTDVVTITMSTISLNDHTNTEIITMSTASSADLVKTTVSMSDMTSTIALTTSPSVTNIESIPCYAVGILAMLSTRNGSSCTTDAGILCSQRPKREEHTKP